MKGRVTFVGAGPGAADLITVRGLRALDAADVVLYDSLVDPELVLGLDAELVFVGKRCGRHSLPQERINELLAEHALGGRHVVRLKGGDPAVLGRLGEEALYLAEAGVPFEIVPGVTSAVAAPELAGIPVTHRGIADSFVVVSARRKDGPDGLSIPPYQSRTTVVLLMPTATARDWQAQMLAAGYPSELPVAWVSAAATREQRVVVTTLAGAPAAARGLPSPTMAVVGWVVRLRTRLACRTPVADAA